MKGITLITSKGLTYEKAASVIKNEFKDLKIECDEKPNGVEEGYLYLGKSPKSLIINFSPTDRLSGDDGFEESELQRIPFEPFATDVDFRLYSVARRLVNAILTLFPDLYVCDDQEGFLGTGAEFLEKFAKRE